MGAMTPQFDPAQSWRVNFFRCEGIDPHRFYSAWQPTYTPDPNFHVPEKFGTLRFSVDYFPITSLAIVCNCMFDVPS